MIYTLCNIHKHNNANAKGKTYLSCIRVKMLYRVIIEYAIIAFNFINRNYNV